MIIDTSGLLAALDPDEQAHDECRQAVVAADEPLILSPFVLAELDHLIRRKRGVRAELQLLSEVSAGAYELAVFDSEDVETARRVIERYSDLDIGLADASLVLLADRYGTETILTLDQRHFRAVTSLKGRPFRLLPGDG